MTSHEPPGQHLKRLVLKRLVWLLLSVGVSLYVLLCVLMALFQRSLLYFPRVLSREMVDQMARSARLQRWTNSAGQFIGLKRLAPTQPAVGSVLIAYGNGSTAIGCGHFADDIQRVAALDVFILEYPGYEDRPGSPSRVSLFSAADEALRSLPEHHPIFLVGESLGTGIVSYLAGTQSNRVNGVLLISPFNNLTAVAQYHYPFLPISLLLADRFPSDTYLQNYHGRVGITVDGKDDVVPEKFGRRLFSGYAGPKKLWEFPDGGHCWIMTPEAEFWQEVFNFWEGKSL